MVVGAGLAGLAAAYDLQAAGVTVTVLEAGPRVGGKVTSSEVGGLLLDEGADAMLARVPYAVDLARELGLEMITPKVGQASLWVDGTLRPLPAGTVLGIPGDLRALAASGVLTTVAMARLARDVMEPGEPLTEDVAVGAYVASRLGQEVTDRLVDPLLGGVYAGHASRLSLRATVPALAGPTSSTGSLLQAVAQVRALKPPEGPVFQGLRATMGSFAPALAAHLDVRLRATVRAIDRAPGGWRVTYGSAADPQHLEVDAVVVAAPAPAAAKLLPDVTELGDIGYASVALVTLVLDGPSPGTGSGFLVPAVEGRTIKAATFTSRKWGRPGPAVVRASIGRHGEERDLQRTDEELVAVTRADLELAVGPVGRTVDARVTRWGGGLPQYTVGHVERVARIRAAVARQPRRQVAGAAYDGVGVPAVIHSGRQAARALLEAEWPHG